MSLNKEPFKSFKPDNQNIKNEKYYNGSLKASGVKTNGSLLYLDAITL